MSIITRGTAPLKILWIFFTTIALLLLSGCGASVVKDVDRFSTDIDPLLDYDEHDVHSILRPNKTKVLESEEDPLDGPDLLQPLLDEVALPTIQNNVLVSLTIHKHINIRDVLIELARKAELDFTIDSNVNGGIDLSVHNKPVMEVIELVSEMAGLRYQVENGVLKVFLDGPYLVNYKLDLINMTRSGSSSMNVQTQGEGSKLSTGSQSQLSMEYSGDIWASIEENLDAIMEADLQQYKAHVITAPKVKKKKKSQAINPAAALGQETSGIQNMLSSQAALSQLLAGGAPAPAPAAIPSSPDTALLEEDDEDEYEYVDTAATPAPEQASHSSYYTINKQAGIISVMANHRRHKEVKKYLDHVNRSVSTQVLIEAKIVQVKLKDEFQSGINWGAIDIGGIYNKIAGDNSAAGYLEGLKTKGISFMPSANANQGIFTQSRADFGFSWARDIASGAQGGTTGTSVGGATTPGTTPSGTAAAVDNSDLLDTAVKFLGYFGYTRSLQNPRIMAMNNQQATQAFVVNNVYFTLDATLDSSGGSGGGSGASGGNSGTGQNQQQTQRVLNVTSTPHSMSIGIVFSVMPCVNIDTNEIILHIRPSITSKDGEVNDPGVGLLIRSLGIEGDSAANISSSVPKLKIQELDTMFKIKDGDVAMIGGLSTQEDRHETQGVPVLSKIPLLGSLFRSKVHTTDTVETVILIRAKIIPPNGYYDEQDKQIYTKLSQDARPLRF